MQLEWSLILPLLAILVLALLLTGPGMWSESWGHGWLEKLGGRRSRRDDDGR